VRGREREIWREKEREHYNIEICVGKCTFYQFFMRKKRNVLHTAAEGFLSV